MTQYAVLLMFWFENHTSLQDFIKMFQQIVIDFYLIFCVKLNFNDYTLIFSCFFIKLINISTIIFVNIGWTFNKSFSFYQ
jgi:hypothetical protein